MLFNVCSSACDKILLTCVVDNTKKITSEAPDISLDLNMLKIKKTHKNI